MKRLIIVLFIINTQFVFAQNIAISDPGLFTRMSYYCPAATTGANLLDTTHPCLTSITHFSTQGIGVSSLDGLQYFTGLIEVNLDYGDNLSEVDIQFIPPSVTTLIIQGNNFPSISTYPPNLEAFSISNNNSLTSISNLPSSLQSLGLDLLPSLSSIDAFPSSLLHLNMNTVSIPSIPILPASIGDISMWYTEMPTIDLSNASNLTYLEIYYCDLSSINLSACTSLTGLGILGCQITTIDAFPPLVVDCVLAQNNLQSLPAFPLVLNNIYLNDNPLLANLPTLPASLQGLTIANTSITCIPNRADLEANNLGMNDFDATTFPVCAAPNLIFIPNTAIVDEIALLCPSSVVNQNFIDTTNACYQNMKSLNLNFSVSDMTGMHQLSYLDSLFISQLDGVTTLDQNIPSHLVYLKMDEAYDVSFTNLPMSLKEIVMLYGNVIDADFQSSNLERLTIENAGSANQFYYPSTMKYIDFCPFGHNWSMINTLPEGFESIYIDTSFITCLANLPNSLFVNIGNPLYTDLVFGDTTLLQCSPLDYLGLIPDAGFRQYINDSYPGLFSGNFLDTIHPFVWNLDSMNLTGYSINDLEGIQYFKSLKHLIAPSCGIQNIPSLPDSLITIILNNNLLTNIPNIPPMVTLLILNDNNLSNVGNLPTTLLNFQIKNNQLLNLPSIPSLVEVLRFDNNQVSSIPTLPNTLTHLSFSHNSVSQLLDILPQLIELNAEHNQITTCPDLSSTLVELNIGNNLLTSVNSFPNTIQYIYIDSNQISQSITIPANTLEADFTLNEIDSVFLSGNSVITHLLLGENSNLIFDLLSNSITNLDLSNTNQDTVTTLPSGLNWLDLSNNNITEVFSLPSGLTFLDISDNAIICLPVLPNSLEEILYSNTNIGCFPNYPNNPNFTDFSQSLCSNFPNSPCIGLPIVRGEVFMDYNGNGLKDTLEIGASNKPVVFQPGNYLIYTDSNGWYSVQLDTNINYSFAIPAIYYSETTSPLSIHTNGYNSIDTALAAGILYDSTVNDLKVFITEGPTPSRPGFHSEKIISLFSFGTDTLNVMLTFKPDPLQIVLSSSPQPDSISSGIYYWNFSNFSPGFQQSIHISDSTPVNVPLGTLVNTIASISPFIDDYTIYDNYDTLTTEIVGSYDPNDKSTSIDSIHINSINETSIDYLIRFQNTGTFPATFVVLKDTIDSKLDISSFIPIAASHNYTFQFNDRVLTVRFDNINLADSFSNEAMSHGFFAYVIEPLENLVVNDEILNTCYIYFDYNTPIITNTTETTIYESIIITGVNDSRSNNFKFWPNPAKESIFVLNNNFYSSQTIIISDLSGKTVKQVQMNSSLIEIGLSDLSPGMYIFSMISETGNNTFKIIKE